MPGGVQNVPLLFYLRRVIFLYLVIAEKPSVAHSIGEMLEATEKKSGYLAGTGCLVTWCIGHLVELAQRLEKEEVDFSDLARKELAMICAAVNEILTVTVDAFARNDNEAAKAIEPLEEVIDDMVMILRDRHTKRLKNGTCSVGTGLIFMEALTYLERASDQCSSIAVMMLARNNDAILQNHYDYLREIHSGNDAAYAAELNRRREQYIKPLKQITY